MKWYKEQYYSSVLRSKIGPKLESKLSRIDLFQTRQSQIITISILGSKEYATALYMQFFFKPASFRKLLS